MISLLANSDFVRALLTTLLHFIWQGVVIAAALWIVLAILPKRDSSARHAAACTALLLMAAAPVATFFAIDPGQPGASIDMATTIEFDLAATAQPSLAEVVTVAMLATWLAGVIAMSLRLFGGLWHLRSIIRHHASMLDAALTSRLEQLARRMDIGRRVRFMQSTYIDVPMTVGWLRPIVLIPCSVLSSMPPLQLDAIIAHELSHIRRHDYLVNLLQSILEAVLFYHPCVFWVSNQVRAERECCCDDTAVALGYDPLLYARALTELEALRSRNTMPALASTGGSLMTRIKRIVQSTPPARGSARTLLAPALVMGTVVALTMAGLAACGAATDEVQKAEETPNASAARAIGIRWLPPVLDPWKPLILAAASRHNIDPDALAIMMLIESSGNPEAQSPSGAVGLMQIMPKTGESIAKERNLSNFSLAQLKEPETNVDFGAWYLARQVDAFGKDKDPAESIELAAAAYNGGTERVRAYIAGAKTLSEETTQYKALVAGMYSERSADQSNTYRAWRERIRQRAAQRATPPVTGARVTMPYGEATNPFSGKREKHAGIDLAKDAGTPVVAPLGGRVRSAAADGDRGNAVVLDHGNGLETRFHHLGDVAVTPGQTIAKGDKIGTVGSTGKSTGPHVHFEVRDQGEPIDPSGYVSASETTP
ncbi:MAG: peptidoglycan DD-metalloendopeptidase family protein [Polyangiaceae bacterium]|nr:peptidoglycan DD-metalloendopeptidase family protein [Polyangiaceae bacterium]